MSDDPAWETVGHRMEEVLGRAGAMLQRANAAIAWQAGHYHTRGGYFDAWLNVYRSGDVRDDEDLVVEMRVQPIDGLFVGGVVLTEGKSFVLAEGPSIEFEIDAGGAWQQRMLDYATVVERFLAEHADTMRDVVT
jgi:hypothetical protein